MRRELNATHLDLHAKAYLFDIEVILVSITRFPKVHGGLIRPA